MVQEFISRPTTPQPEVQLVHNLFESKYRYVIHAGDSDIDRKFAEYLVYLDKHSAHYSYIISTPAKKIDEKWLCDSNSVLQLFVGFVSWDDMALFKTKFGIK